MSFLHHTPHWVQVIKHLIHAYREQEIRRIWRHLRRIR